MEVDYIFNETPRNQKGKVLAGALKAIVDIKGKMKNKQVDGQDLPDNWDESAAVIFGRIDEVLEYYGLSKDTKSEPEYDKLPLKQ